MTLSKSYIPNLSFAALALCACSNAMAQEEGGWDWMIAPYGWAASIDTGLKTETPPSSSSNDTEFDDLVDKLDGAFEMHVEGQGDHFGAFADFTYLGLADSGDHPRFRTESDLDSRLFDLAAVWSPGSERMRGAELFAGLRYIDVDFTAQLEPLNPAFPKVSLDTGKSFSDFLVGARYTWAFAERWGLTLRGDGSWGDTDGTWNASVVGQYRTTHGAWLFGYRYLDVRIEVDGRTTELKMHGPEVGYGFRF